MMNVQMDRHQMIKFKEHGDEKGRLVVIEGMHDIPFEIKRVFYIYGSDSDVVRGKHANRRSEFVLINICGSLKVWVHDGQKEEIFVLDSPHTGIYLPKMVWKNMYDFSSDSILLVLASEPYDPEEYIRDFDEYLKEVSSNE